MTEYAFDAKTKDGKVKKRIFRLSAPSFPDDYIQQQQEDGTWVYFTRYFSAFGGEMVVSAQCSWGNYLGDAIPDISNKLEEMEIDMKTIKINQHIREKLPSRLNKEMQI